MEYKPAIDRGLNNREVQQGVESLPDPAVSRALNISEPIPPVVAVRVAIHDLPYLHRLNPDKEKIEQEIASIRNQIADVGASGIDTSELEVALNDTISKIFGGS